MLYLLDANSLITAHNTYYARHRVPEFWAWLTHHGTVGTVKLPQEIYEEVESGNDPLAAWMKTAPAKAALRLGEEFDPAKLTRVLDVYGPNLSEAELIKMGKDPFLVAAALGAPRDRRVVTGETYNAGKQRANKKVPNICESCGVEWITPVQFINELDFTTDWDDIIQ